MFTIHNYILCIIYVMQDLLIDCSLKLSVFILTRYIKLMNPSTRCMFANLKALSDYTIFAHDNFRFASGGGGGVWNNLTQSCARLPLTRHDWNRVWSNRDQSGAKIVSPESALRTYNTFEPLKGIMKCKSGVRVAINVKNTVSTRGTHICFV